MSDKLSRAVGSIVGLAAGDAVGTTLEFCVRDSRPPLSDMVGGGPFSLRPGEWTDDTSMALCLADSLLQCGELNESDLMRRFVRWWRKGENSVNGQCFDIGTATARALAQFERTGNALAGSTDPRTAGNGSLMRLAPGVVRYCQDKSKAIGTARRQSATTHAAPAAVDACAFFSELLFEAINGVGRAELLLPRQFEGASEVRSIAQGSYLRRQREEISSSGYVIHTLEAALWCVHRAKDFEDAVLIAANLGDDADTVGAVTGQIAGAIWGVEGIPRHWRDRLAWYDHLRDRAIRLFKLGEQS